MEDLIDIQGLDHIGMWPLAWGWWVIIAIVLAICSGTTFFIMRRLKYKKSWQYKAYRRLEELRWQLDRHDPKLVLQNLSQEMRKIAMLKTQRETCAGLIGKQWLQWLQENDPLGFDWVANGKLLVDVQYMPEVIIEDADQANHQIVQLLTAAKSWVQKC